MTILHKKIKACEIMFDYYFNQKTREDLIPMYFKYPERNARQKMAGLSLIEIRCPV
jgi:hypothetical protein